MKKKQHCCFENSNKNNTVALYTKITFFLVFFSTPKPKNESLVKIWWIFKQFMILWALCQFMLEKKFQIRGASIRHLSDPQKFLDSQIFEKNLPKIVFWDHQNLKKIPYIWWVMMKNLFFWNERTTPKYASQKFLAPSDPSPWHCSVVKFSQITKNGKSAKKCY